MSESHKNRWTDDSSVVIDVPCVQLSDVLKNNGISHVDIFYLDVEGGELSVLNTFDWSIPIDMINVELDGTNEEKDESVRTLLRAHGYIAPFSISEYCKMKSSENMRRKYKGCGRNELFVLETVWNEWKGFKAST
jgi:Methyltransferase FkbM domain